MQLDANDVRGLRKSRLGAVAVAVLVVERQIVRQFLMQSDGAVRDGGARIDENRQILIFDRDEFGRVLRDILRLRDHQHHRLADEPHAPNRKTGAERNAKRAAADTFEEGGRRGALPSGGNEILAGQDIEDAGQFPRLFDVDLHDLGVRPVGAEEMARDLSAEFVVGCITALARDQSKVFPAAPELMFGQVLFLTDARRATDRDGLRILTIYRGESTQIGKYMPQGPDVSYAPLAEFPPTTNKSANGCPGGISN